MDINRLVYMANQIARNLESRGHGAAVEEAASHIIKYWDPRMKSTILAGDRALLTPIAAEAIMKLQALCRGPPQRGLMRESGQTIRVWPIQPEILPREGFPTEPEAQPDD